MPREAGMRLSPWRVTGAALVAMLVVAAALVAVQWWGAKASVAVRPWFAPYVDVTATPQYAFEDPAVADSDDVVLSFIVAGKSADCSPSWGGAYSLSEARGGLDLDRRIARLRQHGGSVGVSFGGALGHELASVCSDKQKLTDAYRQVVERYDVATIDLDLEGDALVDSVANERRADAIAALQAERRGVGDNLAVWVTLPVTPHGMTSDATDALQALLTAKVDIAGVNVMTMDYGSSRTGKQTMVQASEASVTAARRQLGVLYDRVGLHQNDPSLWAKMGATVMIGQNDVARDVFTLGDARAFNDWAVSNGLGRMSMWSANRDRPCGANYVDTTIVSDACSGVKQGKKTFASALATGFTGAMALGEDTVTTPEPTQSIAPDDPKTSPYPIWSTTSSYLKGTKVVWHHNVYVAKWWTRGDQPDDPVLNEWETPWQLVGPVLPGETPIPQPTLPAGTYPNWSTATAYDKGARVLFDGVPFEAKWWTQGDSPAAAADDADSSPWAPLSQADVVKILQGTR
jgi:chitinase